MTRSPGIASDEAALLRGNESHSTTQLSCHARPLPPLSPANPQKGMVQEEQGNQNQQNNSFHMLDESGGGYPHTTLATLDPTLPPQWEERGEINERHSTTHAEIQASAPCAFKNSMIHKILQFTQLIAFCSVLHRHTSREIHR